MATMALVSEIRDLSLDQYIPVDLYFTEVSKVEPAALLVLTAEIHRCRNLRRVAGRPLVGGTYPHDPAIYQQLQRTGFFKLLNIREPTPATPSQATVGQLVLPFVTDAVVTPERTGTFIDLLVSVIHDTVPMDERSRRYLYGAIIETTKNAGEHAYKLRPKYQPMGKRWWMTGAMDRTRKEVSILLFDQGVGIPATLEPDLRDRAESLLKGEGLSPPDSLMIEVATRPGETSTGQSGRGLGFLTMRKFVNSCEEGELLVYSNKGHYVYNVGGTARADYDASLGGTLIQWRFRHTSSTVSIGP